MNTIARQIFRPTIALIAMMSIVTQSLFTEDNSALTIHEREIYDLIMTNDPGDIWRTSYANPEAMRAFFQMRISLFGFKGYEDESKKPINTIEGVEKAALDAVANNRDIVTQSIKGFQKFFAENLSAHVRLVGISGGRMVKYSIAESGVDSLRLAQARLVFDPVDEKDEAGRLLSSIQGFEEFCFYENGMVLCYIGDVVVLRKAGLKYLILEDPIGRPRHSMIKPAMP